MANEVKNSVLGQLKSLEVNETVSFPANRLSYVRASCALFGPEWGKKFSTHYDKENYSVTVTRTA